MESYRLEGQLGDPQIYQRSTPEERYSYNAMMLDRGLVPVGLEFAPGKFAVQWVAKSEATDEIVEVFNGLTVFRRR